MGQRFTLTTMDGDTLEVDVQGCYVNFRLFDINRSDESACHDIRLSTGASLQLRDAMNEVMGR